MIQYAPIGVVHSPFREPAGTPIQSAAASAVDVEAKVEIFPCFREGLRDLEGFTHLILRYYMHRIQPAGLLGKPFLVNNSHLDKIKNDGRFAKK